MIVIGLSLLGAFILLDKYAIGEFGVSQPIVSGTIIGALCGDISMGIYIGALLQLIFLANLPIGKDVPPDANGAGIAGCGSYFIMKGTGNAEPNLIVIFLVAMLAAIIGSLLDSFIRRMNEQFYYLYLRHRSNLLFYHFCGVGTSFLRGMVLLMPMFAVVSALNLPPFMDSLSKEFVTIIVVAFGVANGLYLFLRRNSYYYVIIGLLCTLAFFVL